MGFQSIGAGPTNHSIGDWYRFCRTPPPLVPVNSGHAVQYDLDCLDAERYRLTVSAAGFARDEIDVGVSGGTLCITGKRNRPSRRGSPLYHGLSDSFDYRFLLLEPLEIVDIRLSDGLLAVELQVDPLEAQAAGNPSTFIGRAGCDAVAA